VAASTWAAVTCAPGQVRPQQEGDLGLAPWLDERRAGQRLADVDGHVTGEPAVERLVHLHLPLLGDAGQPQLGPDDAAALADPVSDELVLHLVRGLGVKRAGGPDPVPELPRFDVYVLDGIRDIGYTTLPCNWLQIMENSVDPHHVEWLHGYYFEFLGQIGGFEAPKSFQKKHVKVAFDEFEYGIIKRRLLEGHSDEDDDWKIGHPLVFPYGMRVGGQWVDQMQIRVPIDDTHTWKLFYTLHHPEGGTWEHQDRPVVYEFPWRREDGTLITDYVEGQDIMAWVSQGEIVDRSTEHLAAATPGSPRCARCSRRTCRSSTRAAIRSARCGREIIELPCEKDKFGAGTAFTDQWITGGSMRYAPIRDDLLALHRQAALARAKAGAAD
jgi:5,5'-dehydrodivanillate O-demethylase oxygenase subunit